jgi:S-(hydroxymethyl)glutathione dehydrogenase/alcohol dehydrogenase
VVAPGTPECGVCYWCVRARPDQCAQLFAKPLHIANRADGAAVTCTGVGSYAEQMRLRETAVFRVESDLPDEQLCLLGCGITSGLGAVLNAAQVEAGSSVAIVGCGQLGLWMVQGAGSPARLRSSPSSRAPTAERSPASWAPPTSSTRAPETPSSRCRR